MESTGSKATTTTQVAAEAIVQAEAKDPFHQNLETSLSQTSYCLEHLTQQLPPMLLKVICPDSVPGTMMKTLHHLLDQADIFSFKTLHDHRRS